MLDIVTPYQLTDITLPTELAWDINMEQSSFQEETIEYRLTFELNFHLFRFRYFVNNLFFILIQQKRA